MKKRILLVAVLQLFLVLNGCSSDSGSDLEPTPEPPVVVIKTPKITSYSKNAGEVGETISIYGENFSDKISDIKITFDGVVATIISATATEIKFTLPQTEKVLPKIVFTILDKEIVNEAKNDYNGNIGILPKPAINAWFTFENAKKSTIEIGRTQIISDKIIYYSISEDASGGVFRTLDGGITWSLWASSQYNTGFYATKNDDGLSYILFGYQLSGGGVNKIPVGGKAYGTPNAYVWKEINSANSGIYSIYVDDNLQKGTIVSQRGDVYVTSNGADFEQVYDAHLNDEDYGSGFINKSAEIDNDHMWIAGQKTVKGIKYPFVLFKNNETDGWKEHYLVDEPNSYFTEISFADAANGFILIANSSIYKTINGGDTWSKVYTGEKFTKFTFKDANTGWAVLENKIYKTTDGGVSWILDYTHDQSIRGISYKNNVVWAFSTDKIIKRYL
ncbi:IPT/TIG domain-containing protein [Flavobacterium pectinovorum]|uniref:IPT/TIG domain-containing protein n=1 Tax=Flavobacterium pectinovorum TaxID=29533 RepID=UPI00265EA749|nr:IPT/TIG domain-containing protein [Flavobacterium pectinovorum]WKL47552.1 IPT/TIG domain-containing protein [Flavobacterium pectinovorum]